MTNSQPQPSAQPRPSRLSFSLRTLLLVTTLLCLLLGRGVYLHQRRVKLGEYMRARSIHPYSWGWTKPWSQPWRHEAAYFLTGNSRWLGEVPNIYWPTYPVPREDYFGFPTTESAEPHDLWRHLNLYFQELHVEINPIDSELIPANESELLLPIDDEGVRHFRDMPLSDGRIFVSAGERKLTATDQVLGEASPISVHSLELISGQTRWLQLFEPAEIYWSGPMTPADLLALESCSSLIHLKISVPATCESELTHSPKLCRAIRWAYLVAENADLDSWRRVFSQSQSLNRLEIHSTDIDGTLRALGPLPRKIFLLKLNLLGEKSSSRGAAIARAMANQQADWELEVNDLELDDDDLIAIFKIPFLTRLKCEGAFTERGVVALGEAKSLKQLELYVSQIDSAALLTAIQQAPSLRGLQLRGVDVPPDTAKAFREALDLRSELQTAKD